MTAIDRIKLMADVDDAIEAGDDVAHALSHLRYETVRRLSPREFADISRRTLLGKETFDDIIDSLIIKTK